MKKDVLLAANNSPPADFVTKRMNHAEDMQKLVDLVL